MFYAMFYKIEISFKLIIITVSAIKKYLNIEKSSKSKQNKK